MYLPRSPLVQIYIKFCVKGHLADVINHANFYLNQIRSGVLIPCESNFWLFHIVQRRIWKKGLILGDTSPHGRTSCNHIFIEDTRTELQNKIMVKFYFGGSYISQPVFHVEL